MSSTKKQLDEFAQGLRSSVTLSEEQAKAITPLGLVIEPGTRVGIMDFDNQEPGAKCIVGTITQISIRPNFCVFYEVIWWSGNDLKEHWFPASLIVPMKLGDGYRTIGFSKQPPTEGQPGRPITG